MNRWINRAVVLSMLMLSMLGGTLAGNYGVSMLPAAEAAAQDTASYSTPIETDPFVRTELFFGTSRADAPPVTEAEWDNFLDTEITPRFPDGLTVLTGIGQFRGSDGVIVQEDSIVLILLYPIETRRDSSDKIEEIRTLYKERFSQESVLRVDDPRPVRTSF